MCECMSVFHQKDIQGRVGQWNVKEERINFSPSNYHQIKISHISLFFPSTPIFIPYVPFSGGEGVILSFIFSVESFCVHRCLCAIFHMTRLKRAEFFIGCHMAEKLFLFYNVLFYNNSVKKRKKKLCVGSLFKCMETPNKKYHQENCGKTPPIHRKKKTRG